MINIFGGKIEQKRKMVSRFVTYFAGGFGVGSGFFIDKNGHFLTCFHVAFTSELKKIINSGALQGVTGNNDHEKLLSFYRNKITRTKIELFDGAQYDATLEKFDENYDIALFKVNIDSKKINLGKVDWDISLNYGTRIFFGGFPQHHSYQPDKTPFAVHEGIVSSFLKTTVGGNEYEHVQINSVNLGGNSGAPVFKERSNRIVGIINGNMNWGNDNVVFQGPNNRQKVGPLRTPLSIAYMTPLKILKKESSIFNI